MIINGVNGSNVKKLLVRVNGVNKPKPKVWKLKTKLGSLETQNANLQTENEKLVTLVENLKKKYTELKTRDEKEFKDIAFLPKTNAKYKEMIEVRPPELFPYPCYPH